jgi:hypothetical protein
MTVKFLFRKNVFGRKQLGNSPVTAKADDSSHAVLAAVHGRLDDVTWFFDCGPVSEKPVRVLMLAPSSRHGYVIKAIGSIRKCEL